MEAVGRDADLGGLTVVEADADFLRSAGQKIRGHAEVDTLSYAGEFLGGNRLSRQHRQRA